MPLPLTVTRVVYMTNWAFPALLEHTSFPTPANVLPRATTGTPSLMCLRGLGGRSLPVPWVDSLGSQVRRARGKGSGHRW